MRALAAAAERLWRPRSVAAVACGLELDGWVDAGRICLAIEILPAAVGLCRRRGIATIQFDPLREPTPSLGFELVLFVGWPRPLSDGDARRLAACLAGLAPRAVVPAGAWIAPLADLGLPVSPQATAALALDPLVVCEAV